MINEKDLETIISQKYPSHKVHVAKTYSNDGAFRATFEIEIEKICKVDLADIQVGDKVEYTHIFATPMNGERNVVKVDGRCFWTEGKLDLCDAWSIETGQFGSTSFYVTKLIKKVAFIPGDLVQHKTAPFYRYLLLSEKKYLCLTNGVVNDLPIRTFSPDSYEKISHIELNKETK